MTNIYVGNLDLSKLRKTSFETLFLRRTEQFKTVTAGTDRDIRSNRGDLRRRADD